MFYPKYLFSSEEEYIAYHSCLRTLHRGDRIIFNINGIEYNVSYISKLFETRIDYNTNTNFVACDLLVGSDQKRLPYQFNSYRDDKSKKLVLEAVGHTRYPIIERKKIAWIYDNELRISKIIKYNPEIENEQKQIKSKARAALKKAQ